MKVTLLKLNCFPETLSIFVKCIQTSLLDYLYTLRIWFHVEYIPGGTNKQQIYPKRRLTNNNSNHNIIDVLKNIDNGIKRLPLKLAYIYSTKTTASEATQIFCRVKQTTAKMMNVSPRTTTRYGMAATATARAPQILQVFLMDTYVRFIPKIKPDDVKLRFPYHQPTKIEGEPEYEQM